MSSERKQEQPESVAEQSTEQNTTPSGLQATTEYRTTVTPNKAATEHFNIQPIQYTTKPPSQTTKTEYTTDIKEYTMEYTTVQVCLSLSLSLLYHGSANTDWIVFFKTVNESIQPMSIQSQTRSLRPQVAQATEEDEASVLDSF
jgi:hypothetical protein